MQLEQVAHPAGREHLPAGDQVVHGGEQPALVDAQAQQAVVEHDPRRERGSAAGPAPSAGTPARAYGPALKVTPGPPSPASRRCARSISAVSSAATRA